MRMHDGLRDGQTQSCAFACAMLTRRIRAIKAFKQACQVRCRNGLTRVAYLNVQTCLVTIQRHADGAFCRGVAQRV